MIIGKREITKSGRPYFIADIAANHDGDLNRAYKLIELAKESGADAAKFQNFKAETIVSKAGFEALGQGLSHQSSWKKSVFDTYVDASVPDDWSEKLKEKCDKFDIEYMTSPYDFASVDLANRFVNAFKIGSGDITWHEIIEYMAKLGKPILLATGASSWQEVKSAVSLIKKYTDEIVLMQCNTNYTASEDNFRYINLNVIQSFKKEYPNMITGLSDHTYGHTTVLGALALGARVFEKHFTDDNDRNGPDHKFSMNPGTWKDMVKEANNLYLALGDGEKRVEENEKETVYVQRRCLYTTRNIATGEVINKDDLFPLRPAKVGGIQPEEMVSIIGSRTAKNIKADTCIMWEDIDIDNR